MITTEEIGITTIEAGGSKVYIAEVQSLGEVLRKNHAWENVYSALAKEATVENVKENIDLRAKMVENALDFFHIAAADTIRKLDIAGYDIDEISEDTGLRGGYINDTINALFLTEQEMKKGERTWTQRVKI